MVYFYTKYHNMFLDFVFEGWTLVDNLYLLNLCLISFCYITCLISHELQVGDSSLYLGLIGLFVNELAGEFLLHFALLVCKVILWLYLKMIPFMDDVDMQKCGSPYCWWEVTLGSICWALSCTIFGFGGSLPLSLSHTHTHIHGQLLICISTYFLRAYC